MLGRRAWELIGEESAGLGIVEPGVRWLLAGPECVTVLLRVLLGSAGVWNAKGPGAF